MRLYALVHVCVRACMCVCVFSPSTLEFLTSGVTVIHEQAGISQGFWDQNSGPQAGTADTLPCKVNLDERVGALWPAEEAEGQSGIGNEAAQVYSPPPTGWGTVFCDPSPWQSPSSLKTRPVHPHLRGSAESRLRIRLGVSLEHRGF